MGDIDILVFLTGEDDIDTAVRLIREEAQNSDKFSLDGCKLFRFKKRGESLSNG
ncbi:hypothetical protein Hanom_Chr17g01564361 [Helianthus anomalus]